MRVQAVKKMDVERFGGLERLYGAGALERLAAAHVAVIGVGGVGSWTVEALARSGVGELTLVDLDEVCVNNVNRQLHALDGTIGRPKVAVLSDRVSLINPACDVHAVQGFFTERTSAELLGRGFSVVVDAIDTLRHKVRLIEDCRVAGIPVVVAGGAGGRRDPTAIQTGDLAKSMNDGLLRQVRRQLRSEHGWAADGIWGVTAVFSSEKPMYPGPNGTVCAKPAGQAPQKLDCATGYGTVSFVTGTFGFALAAAAVEAVLHDHNA